MGSITQVYNSPDGLDHTYNWVAPFGASNLQVLLVGAGGAGGSANATGGRGGGGAGGCFAISTITPVPGDTYTIFVPGRTTTAAGGDATFSDGTGVVVKAKGGAKGTNAVTGSLSGAGGTGDSTGCIGDTFYRGGNGASGLASTYSGSGGGGAGTSGAGGDVSGCTGSPLCAAGVGTSLYGGNGGQGNTTSSGVAGSTAPGPTDSFGNPIAGGGGGGANANNSTLRAGGNSAAGLCVLIFDLADDAPGVSADSVACDAFTGGDDPDIDGRSFDGCGGSAPGVTWEFDDVWNLTGNTFFIQDGTLGLDDTAFVTETQYKIIGAPVCSSTRHVQGLRARVQYPNYDTISTPEVCTLIWEDVFSGGAGVLDGRSLAGGSAGTGTYRRVDNSTGGSSGALLDGAGAVYLPDGNQRAMYDISGLTLPLNYDLVIDVERTSSGSGNTGAICGTVRGHNTYPPVSGQSGLKSYGFYYATEPTDENEGHWGGWVNGSFGSIITGSGTVDPPGDHGVDVGEIRSIKFRVRNGVTQVYSYINPDDGVDPCDADWRSAAGVQDCQFGGVCLGTGAGLPGVGWNALPGILTTPECSYRLRGVRIYEYTPAVSGTVFTDGLVYHMLRANAADATGYQVELEATWNGASLTLTSSIWCNGPSFVGYLRNWDYVPSGIPLTQSEPYTFDAIIADDQTTGNPTIYALVNGVVIRSFDLIADSPDSHPTTGPIPSDSVLTDEGLAFGLYDDNYAFDPTQRAVIVYQVEVICPGDESEFPCEGPPDNPYPWNPPPPTTTPVFSLWVRKNNAWRFVPVDQLHPKFRGQYRNVDPLAPPQVYYRGAWRNIIGQNEMAPPDEPPGGPPPFFDPCELLPGLPPPNVEPIPISGRFIGSQAWPVTQLGPVANGSKRSQGSVSASLVELSQAAARSSVIMGAQGNYRQYLLNGHWDRNHFVDLTVSHLSPMLSQLVTYTGTGTYFGYSAIDDFDSHSLWPPSGVPDTDMAYVFSALHSQLPGIRLGMRGRPSQFSFDPGADFYEAQYKSWMGLTASQFATLEYNGARSRGALVCLNLNYLHGGNGSSGLRWNDGSGLGESAHNFICSPTEVVDYLSDMFDTARNIDGAKFLAGSVGYMYDPFWIAIPGMLDAITIARNVMAQLPPP